VLIASVVGFDVRLAGVVPVLLVKALTARVAESAFIAVIRESCVGTELFATPNRTVLAAVACSHMTVQWIATVALAGTEGNEIPIELNVVVATDTTEVRTDGVRLGADTLPVNATASVTGVTVNAVVELILSNSVHRAEPFKPNSQDSVLLSALTENNAV
jgi:hypothetical protein